MTFPTVQATNTSTQASGTTHTVNLPASIAAGDRLLVYMFALSTAGTIGFSTPSGWTALYNVDESLILGVDVASVCFTKVASGSEGTTLSVTSAAAAQSVHNSYRISGHQGNAETPATATGSSTTPDPPSNTPSFGAQDTLWIAAAHCFNGTADLAAPTNYTNILEANDTNISMGSARRELNAASEDPGTFSNATDGLWRASTVAVQGIAVLASTKMHQYRQRRA